MKFQVPQFIDLEDQIFGPLSFKEFAYLAGGAGLSYIIYRFIPNTYVALLFIIPVIIFACLLTFYKPNNKPFIEMVQSAIIFFINHKLYIWKKEEKPVPLREVDTTVQKSGGLKIPTLSGNKLASLNWDIGIGDKKSAEKNIEKSLNIEE